MRTHISIRALLVTYTLANGCSIPSLKCYNACDPRWAKTRFVSGTVCSNALPILTNVASALTAFGKTINGQVATPDVLAQYITSNGISIYDWSSNTMSRFGVGFELNVKSLEKVKAAICEGKVVILNGLMLTSVLANGYEDDHFTTINTYGKPATWDFRTFNSATIIWRV